MNADSYYDPPGPIAERETTAHCDTCETDQLGLDIRWTDGTASRECYGCGEVIELEGEE